MRRWGWRRLGIGFLLSAASLHAADGAQMPLTLVEGYAVVQVELGGEKLRFVVDTGSERTAIDRKIAGRLRLATQGSGLVSVFNRTLRVELVVLPKLQVGSIQYLQLPALVQDLEFIRNDLRTGIDGILGMDFLRAHSFTINYAARKLVFGAVPAMKHNADFDRTFPIVIVSARIGGHQVPVMVDTGSRDLVLFRSPATLYLPAAAIHSGSAYSNAAGPITLRPIAVGKVQLGNKSLAVGRAFLMATESQQFAGILGVACLIPKRIGFDFERGLMSWD